MLQKARGDWLGSKGNYHKIDPEEAKYQSKIATNLASWLAITGQVTKNKIIELLINLLPVRT